MKVSKILYIILIVVLLLIFGFSAFYVGSYFLESNKQKQEFDDLAAIVESIQASYAEESEDDPAYENTYSSEYIDPEDPDGTASVTMLPEYAALYALNSDIVGWMKIDGTRINYPVMQTPDYVDYYLHRNFKGEYSGQGCLYAREVCDVNEPSDNITIYGHHMRDGSMFAGLDSYQSQSFWEEHDLITFDTLTEHHTYRIFAVFKTTASVGQGFAYHQFVDAESEDEFNEFIATCKALSFYDTGLTPVYGDKIICLSTCEYTQVNGRLVVAAYRID